MQGRPAGRAGGGAGMRRRTAGNVERGRRTLLLFLTKSVARKT